MAYVYQMNRPMKVEIVRAYLKENSIRIVGLHKFSVEKLDDLIDRYGIDIEENLKLYMRKVIANRVENRKTVVVDLDD